MLQKSPRTNDILGLFCKYFAKLRTTFLLLEQANHIRNYIYQIARCR